MDPLSVTASMLGILATTSDAVNLLRHLTTGKGNIPPAFIRLLDELDRLKSAILTLESQLNRAQTLNKDRTSLIKMDVLVVLLTQGTVIMADLDDKITIWQRESQPVRTILHATKKLKVEKRVPFLIDRIHNFVDLVLMVNMILDTPSDIVALETQMTLHQNISQILEENERLTEKLQNLKTSNFENDSHRASSARNSPDLASPQILPPYQQGFETDLQASRVYRRAKGRRLSQDSAASSGLAPGKAGGWSQASGLDNISDIAFNRLGLEQAPLSPSQASPCSDKSDAADEDSLFPSLQSTLPPAQTTKKQSERQLGYSASFFSVSIHSKGKGVLRIDGITLGDINPEQLKTVAWLPPTVNDGMTPANKGFGEETLDYNPEEDVDIPEDFIEIFSLDLYIRLEYSRLRLEDLDRIHLDQLLDQFAERLSYNASSQSQREAAYLVHKNHRLISEILCKLKSGPAMTTPSLPVYIKESVAYRWLLGRAQANLATIPGDPITFGHNVDSLNLMNPTGSPLSGQNLTRCLLEGLVPTRKHEVLLELDLGEFYHEQDYDKEDESVLDRIITFSTAAGQTVALTSGDYMRLMWSTTAEHVLGLLKRALHGEGRVWQDEQLDFNSFLRIKAGPGPGKLTVKIIGCDSLCKEIFEQLGWICAAFQSSKTGAGTWQVSKPDLVFVTGDAHRISAIFFPQREDDNEGPCWKDLFRNPAIVQGFPIPRRSPECKGLEISLEVMALLIGTNRVTEFAGRLYIKGFSAMAVLTTQTADIFVWHFVFNWDGSHISYTDERAVKAVPRSEHPIDMRRVESARHVLGWCPNAADSTGRPTAQYDIGYSGLPKPSPGCAFEKVQISAGYIITGGITAIPGKKDKAVHLTSRDDYISKLKWISTKFVLFYDVSTRRGWLVNGLSALVHIIRASLRHDETDGFEFLLKWDQMEEPPKPRGGGSGMSARDAAIFVLSSEKNQKLPLWRKADSGANEAVEGSSNTPPEENKKVKERDFFRFKDRVEQIYRVMEQMVAHQSHVEEQDGVGFRVRLSPRRRLEGFNFMDIASGEDPIWPQVTSISALGLGWVDLVRSLNAITLFGRDFGDLIAPVADAGSTTMCPEWERLPNGRDYLAVSGSVLKDILKKGNTDSTPWRLVEDVWWHNPSFSHDCVPCTQQTSMASLGRGPFSHTDRVQILLPGSSIHKMNLKPFKRKGKATTSQPAPSLPNTAAIVFGHSLVLPLRWSDRGDPVEATGSSHQLTDVEDSSHIDSQESAVGTSSITPSTENTTPLGGSEILRLKSGIASREGNTGIGQSSERDVEQPERSRTSKKKGIRLIRGLFGRRPVGK